MQAASNTCSPGAAAAPAARAIGKSRRIVDAPMRMFHVLFALCFTGAYFTAEGETLRALHVTLGYAMAGLLVFRIGYGIWGPPQARLALMARKLSGAFTWLRSLIPVRGKPAPVWRQGQNLAMALAVVLLLALTIPLTLTGYGTYNDWGDVLGGDWIAELHEWVGNAMLFIVLAHLALITVLSLLRKRNMAAPMLTGRTEGVGPDLVKKNRVGLAMLILAAVLAYGAWEWQQSPKGLISSAALSGLMAGGSHSAKADVKD